jgi:hypothetical protein
MAACPCGGRGSGSLPNSGRDSVGLQPLANRVKFAWPGNFQCWVDRSWVFTQKHNIALFSG